MATKMAPWFMAFTALTKDQSLVPSNHVKQLTTAYNASSKGD